MGFIDFNGQAEFSGLLPDSSFFCFFKCYKLRRKRNILDNSPRMNSLN